MNFEDVATLKALIAKTLNDMLEFRRQHSQAQHGSILDGARTRILALCEFYDKAALNDAYYKKIEVSAKVLLKDIATECLGLSSKVKYKFIETWAMQEVQAQDMELMDETYQNDYKAATALFTLLMAAKIVHLTPTLEVHKEDQSEGSDDSVVVCELFQRRLAQNWTSMLASLSIPARVALSVHTLERGSSRVYILAELFQRCGVSAAKDTESQKLASDKLLHTHRPAQPTREPLVKKAETKTLGSSDLLRRRLLTQTLGEPPSDRAPGVRDTWYTKGVDSFRSKFCQTMTIKRWGPENTPGDQAYCGLYAMAQSIAAVEGIASADVLSDLMKIKPEAREGEQQGNFCAEDLGIMLEKVRKEYILGIASRVHGTPSSYLVYAIWTPSKAGAVEASAKDQIVVWITNNNLIPGSQDTAMVLNHWESFGPNTRKVPLYLPICLPDFQVSKVHNNQDLLAIVEAMIKEVDALKRQRESHSRGIVKNAFRRRKEDTPMSQEEGAAASLEGHALVQKEDIVISQAEDALTGKEDLKRSILEDKVKIEDGEDTLMAEVKAVQAEKVDPEVFVLNDNADSDDEGTFENPIDLD